MTIALSTWLFWLLGLLLAPLQLGIITRVKARMAGRQGAPLWQPYADLAKLLGKGAVYSDSTTWVFRLSAPAGLAAVLLASLLTPLGGAAAPVSFGGDLILLTYLLAALRFLTVLAALDTASAFEGMGASREATFSALAEPALFLVLAALARQAGSVSLSTILASSHAGAGFHGVPVALLCAAALLIVYLAENCRIPVDDPNTHLELTMIHEVLVLDHGGPDLAFILYGAALKLWILGAILTGLLLPAAADPWLGGLLGLLTLAVLAVVVGLIESSMARLRLVKVPQLLAGASVLAAFALILTLR